jgi:Cof subfamily protein (haloacid dehalogenase superfamily)
MTYQTIILDMDGTLLNETNQVSDRLKNYLIGIRQSGKLIFIATGRTLKEVRDVLPTDLVVDGLVTENGMSVFIGQEQIVEHVLPPSLVQELVTKAGSREIYYEVHPNRGTRFTLKQDRPYMFQHVMDPKPITVEENEWFSRKTALQEKIDWQDQIDVKSISKVYFFSRDMRSIQEWKAELSIMKQHIPFSTFSSTEHNVEVMAANVSKATGIQTLLSKFQIAKDEILAVGDGRNDLPMFKLASYAVAMQNASDFVKEHANEVTEYTYKEEGLYHFLKRTFK